MDDNSMRGMPQLDCLLEKHKQMEARSAFKSHHQIQNRQNNSMDHHRTENLSYYPNNFQFQEKLPTSTTCKVFVNPNYTRRKPVIHINPRVQVKPSIYVNPKLIQNFANPQNHEQIPINVVHENPLPMPANIQNRCSVVHVNPKFAKLLSNVPEENQQKQIITTVSNIQNIPTLTNVPFAQVQPSSSSNSTSVSNTFIQNSSATSYSTPKRRKSGSYSVQSKTKFVRNIIQKKNPNSSLIALSQRKLVRVRRSPRLSTTTSLLKSVSPSKKRLSSSGIRKTKVSPKNTVLNSSSQLFKVNRLKLVRNNSKANYYNCKLDQISSKVPCKKVATTKKLLSNSVGLVSINGVMYNKSRNQLVRSTPSPIKRRRNSILNKNCQYFIAKNGKKLLKLDKSNFKLDQSKRKMNNSSIKLNKSISPVKNYKANASNKVKQRSLQILRNKMRKNNQPCLLFQKFGYCANQVKGICSKVHDKKQVQLCKNFLQGKCLLDDCRLSHDVGPEKMPTCKYFLEGCCTHDGCPYLHVKVSSKNPICVEFLRGYCPGGNKCQKRHTFACPEFDKSGKCSKGKFCPYPHKSHLAESKRFRRVTRRKSNASSRKEFIKTPTDPKPVETRKRYYDETSEDLSQKREKLLKKVKIMKDVYETRSNNPSKEKDCNLNQSETADKDPANCEEKIEALCNKPRRPPIGSLPAYIPID